MNQSFLIRNIPKKIQKQKRYEIKLINENLELKEELNLYKSVHKSHPNSAICNLHIKKKRGKKVWIDKVSQYWELEELDVDKDIIEWLKPIRCER